MSDSADNVEELSDQLIALQDRHSALDQELQELLAFSYVDQLQVQRLKKQKLRIKDTIEKLKTRLIPDLDA